jgi:L-aminopeptidase/D-esterase-like protein
MPPGPHNALTDVAGLSVGHFQRLGRGWQTGTTVVIAGEGAVAGVDVRGGGPGTRETDLLEPQNLVQHVHAVVLTGGSAYGLAAADGVMTWLEEHHRGYPVGVQAHQVVPIVPAAVLFDLSRGASFTNRPDASFGYRAARTARAGRVREGTVGAGTGARAGGLQGGIGTASTVVASGATVAALVAVNASGRVIDDAGRPFGINHLERGELSWRRPTAAEAAQARTALVPSPPPLNTTIGVVATDAALTKAECTKLAGAAHDGLARAVRPAHSMFDGDTFFALSTERRTLVDPEADAPERFRAGAGRPAALNELLTAAAEAVTRAVVRAVLLASSTPALTSYRELFPSSLPS